MANDKPGPVKIDKWCRTIGEQKYKDGNGGVWSIARLVDLSKDLEVFEIPMKGLNIYNMYPRISSVHGFVGHIKQVLDADLSCPIILDSEGFVMDGRHRIAKALLEGRETIKAVRFDETPCADYEEETKD